MPIILGIDVGGANTKASLMKIEDNRIIDLESLIEYFPIWKKKKNQLIPLLYTIKDNLVGSIRLDGVGLTMTAELSDVFWTKREGVNHILDCIESVFHESPIFVLNTNGDMISVNEARSNPYSVAAANWIATGDLVLQRIRDCIIIDVGSTTTSIIPVIQGNIAAAGINDLEKLSNGELIYTGTLRTNVSTIIDSIPMRKRESRISSELFSVTGDVNIILSNIKEDDYTTETPDNRGKTKIESMARLARIICADIEMLTPEEIEEMAEYIYNMQIRQIAEGLKQVLQRVRDKTKSRIKIVTSGIGREILASKAAELLGFNDIVDISKLLGSNSALTSPSAGVAWIAAKKLVGNEIQWML